MGYFILVSILAAMSSAGKMSSSVHFLLLVFFFKHQCFLAVYLPFLGDSCEIPVFFQVAMTACTAFPVIKGKHLLMADTCYVSVFL